MTAFPTAMAAAGLLICAGLGGAEDASWVGDDREQAADVVVEAEECCSCGKKPCFGVCRDPGRPKKPILTKPGDVDRGDCPPLRYRMSDCRRAGSPHRIAKWAKCGVDGKYRAGFVGGGAAFFGGRGRTSTDGTWGLDYGGLFGHANVWLNYTRGRKQGGEGAYATDGEPKLISHVHHILGKGD